MESRIQYLSDAKIVNQLTIMVLRSRERKVLPLWL
jgi:hypothetical protein